MFCVFIGLGYFRQSHARAVLTQHHACPLLHFRSSPGPFAGWAHLPIWMEQCVLHVDVRRCLCLIGKSSYWSISVAVDQTLRPPALLCSLLWAPAVLREVGPVMCQLPQVIVAQGPFSFWFKQTSEAEAGPESGALQFQAGWQRGREQGSQLWVLAL